MQSRPAEVRGPVTWSTSCEADSTHTAAAATRGVDESLELHHIPGPVKGACRPAAVECGQDCSTNRGESALTLSAHGRAGRLLRSVSGVMRPQEEILLEPFNYYGKLPGKGIRPRMIAAFNQWLQVPDAVIARIAEITQKLHNASLMIDDIEDNSKLRRGTPVAHVVSRRATATIVSGHVTSRVHSECTPGRLLRRGHVVTWSRGTVNAPVPASTKNNSNGDVF